MRRPRLLLRAVLLAAITMSLSVSAVLPAHAAFVQNYIIDDGVFDDTSTMTAAQVQTFLNGFPNSCLSNYQAPYPTDYFTYGANASAASIISQTANMWGINPRVILTTLEKEESLVSGGAGCDGWRYNSAMGMGCPDNGACPAPQYAGFSQQVVKGAWQLKFSEQRAYGNLGWDNSGSVQYYGFMTQGTRSRIAGDSGAYYSGTYPIDGTPVQMTNGATAALYTYTPHFSGNQHFVTIFENWFGSTKNSSLNYSVIQGPNSSALYLQTSVGKYYIPSGTVMQAWGLDKLPITQVSQTYLDALNTGPWVSNLLKDDWNNYFVVENNTLHYVRDTSYLPLWNISTNDAVQSLGITRTLASGSWLGRFVTDGSVTNGPIYLVDKNQKHLVNSSMLYQWNYTPDQLTTVSTAFLNTLTTNPNAVTQYANDGTSDYFIDSARRFTFANPNIRSAYFGAQTAVTYNPVTLSFLSAQTANQFISDGSTGQWFMLENGGKHYIGSAELASLWGKSPSVGPTALSHLYVGSVTDGGNLSTIVQTANPSATYVIDGTKRYIPDAATLSAWVRPGQTVPTYSAESLNLLSQGSNATTTINASGSPYSYLMDAGVRRYLTPTQSRDAWGTTVMTTSGTLVNSISEGPFLNYIVKSSDGSAYVMIANKSYLIDPAYYADWGISGQTPTVDASTVARYVSSGVTLKAYITIGGASYAMSGGSKVPLGGFTDSYAPSNLSPAALPVDYLPTAAYASYLVRSTDPQDGRVWLISGGQKYQFGSFASYVSYGYLSRGAALTSLTPGALNLIPTAQTTPGLFIKTANGGGIKFINFGTSLGFPDGDTLFSYLGSAPVLTVSDSIYNSFPLNGSASRIIRDDTGKIYLVQNGQKRWITNGTAYNAYRSYPVAYLFGTTMSLIPDGAPIN